MRTRALSDLIADVRSRSNMEGSEFITDAEITEVLNQELAELHGRLATNEGQPHFRSSTTIAVTAATALYALPDDFWRVQEVTANISGIVRNLAPFMATERARLLNSQLYSYRDSPQYRIQANNIEFLPATQSYAASLYYIAASPRLVDPSDTVDGFNGYEVAAIHGAVVFCLQKEESDASVYAAMKDRIYRQIDALAAQRDGSHPERVTDVVGLDDMPFTFGWGR